jgi:hypothetical protein
MQVPLIVWLAVALVALRFAMRPLLALVYGGRIGARVVAKQPGQVHLEAADAGAARRPAEMETAARAFATDGFADAGWFTIPELPDIVLRLMVHEGEGWLACLYDHRLAGIWLEVNMRFTDSSRIAFVNTAATGLDPLPGADVRHMPGASPGTIVRTARAARAKRDQEHEPVSVSQAPRIFEEGYARLAAQRKAKGVSRREVLAVSLRPPMSKRGKAA